MQGVLSSILRTVLRTENPRFKSEGFSFALFGLYVLHIAPALGRATDTFFTTVHFGVVVMKAGTATGIDSTHWLELAQIARRIINAQVGDVPAVTTPLIADISYNFCLR